MNTEQASTGTFRLDVARSNALMILLQDDSSYAHLDRLVPDITDCTCESTFNPSTGQLPSCAFTIALDKLSEATQVTHVASPSGTAVLTDLPARLRRLGDTCLFLKASHLGWKEDTLTPTFNDLQTLLSDAGTVVRELVIDPGVVAIGVGRSVGSAAAFAVRRLSRG